MSGNPHLRPQDLLLPGAWADRGACRGEPTDVFFPPHARTGRRGRDNSVYRRARLICTGCPVRSECLAHALRATESHGMWGGLTPEERNALPTARQPVPACPDCGTPTWVHAGRGVLCDECKRDRRIDRRNPGGTP